MRAAVTRSLATDAQLQENDIGVLNPRNDIKSCVDRPGMPGASGRR